MGSAVRVTNMLLAQLVDEHVERARHLLAELDPIHHVSRSLTFFSNYVAIARTTSFGPSRKRS